MARKLTAALIAGLLFALTAPAAAATQCQFVLGFATLKTLITLAEGRDLVGSCLADESFNPATGLSTQMSENGLLTWRKSDNWTAFSDGATTWINGPNGLQSRLDADRFDWERVAQLTHNAREFSYELGRHGGSITYASIGEPLTLNLAISSDASTSSILGYVFEGLTETSWLDNKVEPALAQSWKRSEDGLTWTFVLRRDVTWHDGRPFTAADVDFTFNRIIYNDDIGASARPLFTFRYPDAETGEWTQARMKVTAMGDRVVRFELPTPFAPFLRSLGTSIYPRHILEEYVDAGTFDQAWGPDTDPNEIIGTGPFKFVRWDRGEEIALQRNPRYWLKDANGSTLPYLDGINIKIVPDLEAELGLFLAGETDSHGVLGKEYAELKPMEAEGNFVIHHRGPTFGSTFFGFNLNPRSDSESRPYVDPVKLAWFQNDQFRRAAAHSLDRDRIVAEALSGFGTPQWSSVSPSAGDFHNPDVRRFEYDPQRANQILDELGWLDGDGNGIREDGDGNEISFTLITNTDNSVRERVGRIVQQGLADVGVGADFQLVEFGDLVTSLTSTYDWEAMVIGFTGGTDPYSGISFWHSSGLLHLWNPQQTSPATDWEAEIDDLYVKASQELDHATRVAHYHRAQAIAADYVPVIYTAHGVRLTALRDVFGNSTATLFGLFDSRYVFRVD